jgi:hypothetical protein
VEVGAIIDLHMGVYQHLSSLYQRTDGLNAAQAAYLLGLGYLDDQTDIEGGS